MNTISGNRNSMPIVRFLAGKWLALAPALLIGFPPDMVALALTIRFSVMWFHHTELCPRLPRWIELVFVTPYNHRIHHGADAPYLDKNFGGILIVWDRLFGTYQDEVPGVPLRIGVAGAIQPGRNPLAIHFAAYAGILREAAGARGWRGALACVFGPNR